MRRLMVGVTLFLAVAASGFAQQPAANPAATKQDVESYFQVMHIHQMIVNTTQAMIGPMHQMIHEEFLKNKAKCNLPPDFEAKMQSRMDSMMTGMPWDQMIEAMEPAYEKNFSAAELHALTAFYGGSMGQEILSKMPAATADSMKAMMPMLQSQMATLQQDMKKDVEQAVNESGQKSCPGTTSM